MGTLTTRLVVEGEAEYKKAISSANTELKALGSAMDLVSTQAKGSANSLEALTQKQELLTRAVEVQQQKYDAMTSAMEANKAAIADLNNENDQLAQKLQDANKELERMDKNAEGAEKKQANLEKTIKSLNEEIQRNNDRIGRLQDNTNRWQDSANKAAIELDKLQKELSDTNGYVSEAQQSTDGMATSIDGFGKAAAASSAGANQMAGGISAIMRAIGLDPMALKNMGVDVDALGASLNEGASSANGFAAGIAGIVGAGAGLAAEAKIIGAMVEDVIEYKRMVAEIQVGIQLQMDQTSAQAEKTYQSVDKVYSAGFGENRENVAAAMQDIQKYLGVTGEDAEALTKQMMVLNTVFGADTTQTIGAVNVLMKEFGITAQEAFDFIASGFGEIKDQKGELLPAINEYASAFADLGYTAEDMYAMLKAAGDEGASSLSSAAQLIQQFYQSALTEKDRFSQALEALGFDAENMMNRISAGGESASAAIEEINNALAGVADEGEKAQLAADLFGRNWSRVGEDVVDAMTGASGAMDEFAGAASSMAETYGDSMAAAIEKADRFKEKLLEAGKEIATNAAMMGIPDLIENAFTLPTQAKDAFGELTDFIDRWNQVGDNMNFWEKIFASREDWDKALQQTEDDFKSAFATPLNDAMDEAIAGMDKSQEVQAAGEATLNGLVVAAENAKPAIVAAFEAIGLSAAEALMSNIPEWAFNGGLPGAGGNSTVINQTNNFNGGLDRSNAARINRDIDELLGARLLS